MAKRPSAHLSTATRIAAIVGPDPFLREQHVASLREALEAAHGRIDTIRFDGNTASLSDVLDECRTFGLMRQHKLVIVDDADQFVKEATRPALIRYAEAPSPDATLVLRASKWVASNLDKAIEKVGAVVKCDAPNRLQAATWAINRAAKRYSAELTRDAAARIVDRTGPELARIDSELAKLAAIVGQGGSIGAGLVAEIVDPFSQESTPWPLQETLLLADPVRALTQLKDLLEARVAPTLITFACLDLARKLHAFTEGLAAGIPAAQLAREQKLWGAARDLIPEAAGRLDRRRAAALLAEAVEADYRQKTGLGEPERTLERLVLRFPSLLS